MAKLFGFAFALLVLGLICSLSSGYAVTFEVAIGSSETSELDLQDGDLVSGRVTLAGGSIDFSVVNPDGSVLEKTTVSGLTDFEFKAVGNGRYNFIFQNNISDEVAIVAFNYNVQHYLFGFPQEFVLLFAIVGLSIVAVAVFIALSPKP